MWFSTATPPEAFTQTTKPTQSSVVQEWCEHPSCVKHDRVLFYLGKEKQMQKRRVVEGVEPRLLTKDEAATYCGQGLAATMRLAKESGAILRVGRRVMVDRKRLDRAIDLLATS